MNLDEKRRTSTSEKRTTRTSGNFVEEEVTIRPRGLIEDEGTLGYASEERTRRNGRSRASIGRQGKIEGRTTRAQTAPVNVEALQIAKIAAAERNSGKETHIIKYLL